ncbi:MAG: AbrB/MazE/SpoVT family DNA-binding domain-containing protein [Candidatus Dadabacteria bacterium]|nr:MAG: AbrB/MazE/SpoVT family DNA-binding domain-containing protein [Candidatus Dadabacteria bacterium]
MPTATLTSKGQTTIPKEVRDYLGLRSGDRIDFVFLDGRVVLQPATRDVRELRGCLRKPGRGPVTVEQMAAAVKGRVSKAGA